MRYFFLGGALAVFSHLALSAFYTTSPIYYHHRSVSWFVLSTCMTCLGLLWSESFQIRKVSIAAGIFSGSAAALMIDHLSQGGVENYWHPVFLGYAFCLPDILLMVSAAYIVVQTKRRINGEEESQAQRSNA